MPDTTLTPAEINRRFAERILVTAADIVDYEQPDEGLDAVAAILQAKNQILSAEPDHHRALRSYGGSELIPDFGRYIAARFPEFRQPTGFGLTIGPWCRRQNTRAVAETLRAAAPAIGRTVEQRTIIAEQRSRLNDGEADQLVTLDHFNAFLTENKAAVDIRWNKPYDACPAKFQGTINGARWSFAVVPLTRAGAIFASNSDWPINPVQSALEFASYQAAKAGFPTGDADRRQCLVIHNRELTEPCLWGNITLSTHPFDALAILHEDEVTATRVWEIYPADTFGYGIPSRTVLSLNRAVQSRLAERPGVSPTALRDAWSAIEEAGLTEADILQIAQQG